MCSIQFLGGECEFLTRKRRVGGGGALGRTYVFYGYVPSVEIQQLYRDAYMKFPGNEEWAFVFKADDQDPCRNAWTDGMILLEETYVLYVLPERITDTIQNQSLNQSLNYRDSMY